MIQDDIELGSNRFEEQIDKDVDRSLLCFENFENCSEQDLLKISFSFSLTMSALILESIIEEC